MITPEEFLKLKREVEDDQRERDQAEGALRQELTRLKDDLGIKTLREAKQLLKQLEIEGDKLNEELDRLWNEFNEKWKDEKENTPGRE